jgi:hypothetical protein
VALTRKIPAVSLALLLLALLLLANLLALLPPTIDLAVCLNISSAKTNNNERDEVVIAPLHWWVPSHFIHLVFKRACPWAHLISSGSRYRWQPLQCLLPPFLYACVTPVYVSHIRKISTVISQPPGLYVDHHSINDHLTRTVRATGSLKAQLWSCGRTFDGVYAVHLKQLIKVICVYHTVSTHFATTTNSANMHVLCHRGQKDVTAAAVTLNFCFH